MGSIWAGQLRAQAPDELVAFTGTGREQEGSAPRRCPADRPRRETPAADADVSCDTRAGRCIMHTRTHETLPVGPAPRDRVGCGWLEEPRGRPEAFLWRPCWAVGTGPLVASGEGGRSCHPGHHQCVRELLVLLAPGGLGCCCCVYEQDETSTVQEPTGGQGMDAWSLPQWDWDPALAGDSSVRQ